MPTKPSVNGIGIQKGCGWLGRVAMLAGVYVLLGLASCASSPQQYVERHDVNHLTVVFLDEQSLQDEWTNLTGRDSVQFMPMRGNVIALKSVQGFYNFKTKTLYCQKWNFEVCGHELHHAVLGQFHASD